MNEIANPQQDPSWIKKRIGKATASRMADLMAVTKNGPSAKCVAYLKELVFERLTDRAADHFVSRDMQWGIDQEPNARAAYEMITGADAVVPDFIDHPTIAGSGASPDGLVGDDGLVEFKCPSSMTHIDTLLAAAVPEERVHQLMWQMAVTGRAWCDFVSYDPRLPAHLQIFVKRVARDEALIAKMEDRVRAFLTDVDVAMQTLGIRYPATSELFPA
jgi:putative phage-type endonuclease